MSMSNSFGLKKPRCYGDGLGDEISEATGLRCEDESLTDQSFKDDADINVMMARMGLAGEMPPVADGGLFVYDEVFDFQEAQNRLRDANVKFMALPAKIRARFEHDPAIFADFCSNPENLDELRKMGLANPAPVVDNPPVPDGQAK